MENVNKKTSVRLVIPNLYPSLKDIDTKHREWTKHFEGYECGIRENGDCYVVVDVKDIACKIMFGMRWDSVDMRIDDIFKLKHNRECIPHSDDNTFEIYYDIFHSNHYYLDRDFKNILLIVQIIINDVEISDSEAKIRDILNLITNVYNICHTSHEQLSINCEHYTKVFVIHSTPHCDNDIILHDKLMKVLSLYMYKLQSEIIGASIDITSDTIKLSQEYNTLCDICALK